MSEKKFWASGGKLGRLNYASFTLRRWVQSSVTNGFWAGWVRQHASRREVADSRHRWDSSGMSSERHSISYFVGHQNANYTPQEHIVGENCPTVRWGNAWATFRSEGLSINVSCARPSLTQRWANVDWCYNYCWRFLDMSPDGLQI